MSSHASPAHLSPQDIPTLMDTAPLGQLPLAELSHPSTTPSVILVLALSALLLVAGTAALVVAARGRRPVVQATATLLMVLGAVSAGVLLTSPGEPQPGPVTAVSVTG